MHHQKMVASALLLFSLVTQGSLVYAASLAAPKIYYPNTTIEVPSVPSVVTEAAEEPPSTPQPTAVPTPTPSLTPTPMSVTKTYRKPTQPTYVGSHTDWMTAAGIAESDFSYVEYIINRESGWRPDARNGKEGACGLVQALPCSKLGENWQDPIHALEWGNSYVSRYGGWAGAYEHWLKYSWY